MQERRSLRLPVTLGVAMIVMLIALTIGWVILSVRSALDQSPWAPVYWWVLTIGSLFLVFTLIGVVVYLTVTIKAINLSQRQSNFIDSVTHELKSPIASLKLYLQTLTKRNLSDTERQEFYEAMLEDVERLDQLINHVLDAARLERTIAEKTTQHVQLDELLRRCASDVCQYHRVPPEVIQLKLAPCVVYGTQPELELVFRNLIDNAVKYAGKPPEVTVAIHQTLAGQVSVLISDNGRGIPYNQRKKIFGRFVRLGPELERDKPGTGLGLYIVRTLVARLRGRVRVRGLAAKRGTTFEVLLPGTFNKKVVSSDDSSRLIPS